MTRTATIQSLMLDEESPEFEPIDTQKDLDGSYLLALRDEFASAVESKNRKEKFRKDRGELEDERARWELVLTLEDDESGEEVSGYYWPDEIKPYAYDDLAGRVRAAADAWLDGAEAKVIATTIPADDGELSSESSLP